MKTHTETQHKTLPKLHRIQGDFTLMDSDKKEFFPVSHAVLDELCHRSNAFPALLAALETVVKSFDHNGGEDHPSIPGASAKPIREQARAAIAAAKAP